MDFQQAAEEIKATKYQFDNITVETIEEALKEYVERLVDDINADPNGCLSNEFSFWGELNKKCAEQE